MGLDWALYSGLRGTDNWAQRRQDKAFDLQLMQQMQKNEQLKVQNSIKAEEEVNKYFDEITGFNADMLPEDAARIQEVEKKSRQSIIKGIAAYNGDLSRYISSGGITDLGEYKRSIMNSKAVKNAQMNKISMGAILKDFQDGGKYIHNVDVDIPELNPDGTQKVDEQGNAILKRKKVRPEEALKLFKDKVIDKINYNGSENIVKLNAMSFKGAYRDPRNPTSKNNNVTSSDIIFQAMEAGASEDYANQLADSYIERYKATGETWKWNAMSDEEYALQQAKLNKAKGSSGGGGQGGQESYRDIYGDALSGIGQGNIVSAKANEWVNQDKSVGAKGYTTHTVSADITKEISNQLGLDFSKINGSEIRDKDGDLIDAEKILNPNILANPTIISPRTGEKVNLDGTKYTVTNISPKIHRIDGKSYVEATIYTNEETLDKTGIRNESGIDHITDAWKSIVEDLDGGGITGDNYSITSFIELNDSPNARKMGTNNLQNAQWKEDSDVRGTGNGQGRDVIMEQNRQYYE